MVEGVASFLLVFWSAVAALMQEMHGTLSFPMVCLVVALTVGFVLWWLPWAKVIHGHLSRYFSSDA